MPESIQRWRRSAAGWLLLTAFIAAAYDRPSAHEIPASVLVQVFARPDGDRLHLLVRVPLASMRDVTFPSPDGAMLDVGRTAPLLADMARTWLAPGLRIYEGGRALDAPSVVAARVSLPSDRSFTAFEDARAHLAAAPLLPPDTALPISAALLDVHLEYRIQSDRARFDIDPEVARLGLRVVTVLRFSDATGSERVFQFSGDPGRVHLDPTWTQAALTFVRLGFSHILDGIDHLLFLLCLVLPVRRLGHLIVVVTAFTAAHSVTLAFAAFGLVPDALWFPPLVETLIAASIVYMALENIIRAVRGGPAGVDAHALRARWVVAGAFGLVHGFGFSFALQETLQLAGAHLAASLFAFNVGIELGQILVLMIAVPVLGGLYRLTEPRVGIVIASALVAHTAWHWMIERGASLGAYDWSLANPATLATALRVLAAGVAIAGVVWVVRTFRAGKSS